MTVSPILLSPEDTAALLGISRQQVYRLLAKRRLAGIKVGRARRITRESIDAYVAERIADASITLEA